jgi:hypothetical protein
MMPDETPTAAEGFTRTEYFFVSLSRGSAISLSSASRCQIKSAQQANQLSISELHALSISCCQKLERAPFQSLVPNAIPITIPKQEFQMIAIPVHE